MKRKDPQPSAPSSSSSSHQPNNNQNATNKHGVQPNHQQAAATRPSVAHDAPQEPKVARPERPPPVRPTLTLREKTNQPAIQHHAAAADAKTEEKPPPAKSKLQEQEDASIELLTAQKFKAFEAEQKRKADEEERKRLQEEASLEQMMAQQYKAYEAEQKRKDDQKRKLQEQEELSIDQMNLQQYKAYEARMLKLQQEESKREQDRKKKDVSAEQALLEADAMLDQFAPPPKQPASKSLPADKPKMDGFFPDSGLAEDRNEISEILDKKIFLTNYRGAERLEDLKARKIRHIVCVNEQENEFPDEFHYFNIDTLEDQEDHDAAVHFANVSRLSAPFYE